MRTEELQSSQDREQLVRADMFVRSKTTRYQILTQELQNSEDHERIVRADMFVRSRTTNFIRKPRVQNSQNRDRPMRAKALYARRTQITDRIRVDTESVHPNPIIAKNTRSQTTWARSHRLFFMLAAIFYISSIFFI